MKHARLELARSADILPPLNDEVAVFGQIELERLRGLDFANIRAVSDSFVTSKMLSAAGIEIKRKLDVETANAVVFIPRAKAAAWQLISMAIQSAPQGWIIVDGQKTDGIESIAKEIARSVTDIASYSKGHGKTIWFRAEDAQNFQITLGPSVNKDGFLTAPGVFSADSVDLASAFLIETIPNELSGEIADIGSGWGYLSACVLAENPKIKTMHLIEDNATALDCARQNVTDPRASFHWANALTWRAPKLLDAILMNPPFHTGRSAEPSLGISFINTAARALRPGGVLYMVANAHLPYEPALEQSFVDVEVMARTTRFKIFCAKRGRNKIL